ncbi:MAG TPA: glycosyltransferase family 4 protein [Vicinamibacterales bacterium]|nr:glycosyltransferase family 4 protein [Vicinamibacterales bacterium]
MKILWVKMGGLWPPTSGGRTRSLKLITELSRRHEVTVVTTHAEDDDPDGLVAELRGCRRVISFDYSVPKRGSRMFPFTVARSWLSSDPVDLWKWRVSAVRDCVRELVDSGSVDVCVADFLFAVNNVPLRQGTPVILFEHNVEYLIWKRLADLERSPWRKALLSVEWRKLRSREAVACRNADLTIAVSAHDRDRLASLAPGAAIDWIPTGVDTDYFTPDGNRERPNHIVFSGSMDWHPNDDAVRYFLADILPKVRREIPAATFSIVGRNPSAALTEAAAAGGASVSGTLDDIRPAIAEASLCVVPLRAGSGTRLKIFEALSMGKALVSTSLGAEGLDITSGMHYLEADGAQPFADAVVALLKDDDRRRKIAAAGRALVAERYSWAQVARPFERHCYSVIETYAHARAAADGRPHLSPARTAR